MFFFSFSVGITEVNNRGGGGKEKKKDEAQRQMNFLIPDLVITKKKKMPCLALPCLKTDFHLKPENKKRTGWVGGGGEPGKNDSRWAEA